MEKCSICGREPAIHIDGNYWKCHDCIREGVWEHILLVEWLDKYHDVDWDAFYGSLRNVPQEE